MQNIAHLFRYNSFQLYIRIVPIFLPELPLCNIRRYLKLYAYNSSICHHKSCLDYSDNLRHYYKFFRHF